MDLTALASLVQSMTTPFAFCGVGIKQGGQRAEFHFSTAPGLPATEHSLFRAASISKIVTARTLQALVKQNKLSLDLNIADLLGVPFQHPAYPATPLTLRMLLRRRA